VPYKTNKAPNGDLRVVSMGGKDYTPPEISAMILGKIKRDAEAYLGEPVTQAVITVPAYFNDASATPLKMPVRLPVWKCCVSSMNPPLPPCLRTRQKRKERNHRRV
jgi:hypothetical protein